MKPVHTYIKLVQCSLCRHTFMPLGEECCWRCAPEGIAPTRAQLAAARLVRQGAEMADGSLGSLTGLGFAPLVPAPVVFGPPRREIVPVLAVPEDSRRPTPHATVWLILRWAAVVLWLAVACYAIVAILQHRPMIGPRY